MLNMMTEKEMPRDVEDKESLLKLSLKRSVYNCMYVLCQVLSGIKRCRYVIITLFINIWGTNHFQLSFEGGGLSYF